jgi:hypothetical protein
MSLVGDIREILETLATAGAVKERLAFACDQLQLMEKKVGSLEEENRQLHETVRRLTREVEAKAIPDEFVEYHGVLFRRGRTGVCERMPYCPRCKIPLISIHDSQPMYCSLCEFATPIIEQDLYEVLAEIAALERQ